MNFKNLLEGLSPENGIALASVGLIVLLLLIILYKKIKRIRKGKELNLVSSQMVEVNQSVVQEIRQRIVANLNTLSTIISLHPVIPGNIPDDTTLGSRNRTKCVTILIDSLPHDFRGQGIRMAEFIHQLCDNLIQAYGKEEIANMLFDIEAIILDIDSATSVGLIMNELISNALEYAPMPGEKSKINIIFKERGNKLFLSVGDNGTGMKSPYIPKFSFGLQLVNKLVQKHKGEMIITSRPGTRIEITLTEYRKAIREVFVTPTTKVY